jgi:hypothetical protein
MKGPSPSASWWSSTTLTSLLLLTTATTTTATTTTAATTAATAPSSSLAQLACDNLVVGDHKYNLQALAGPHVAVTHEYTRPTYHNTTYAIDVCAPLVRKGDGREEERCPEGTRG